MYRAKDVTARGASGVAALRGATARMRPPYKRKRRCRAKGSYRANVTTLQVQATLPHEGARPHKGFLLHAQGALPREGKLPRGRDVLAGEGGAASRRDANSRNGATLNVQGTCPSKVTLPRERGRRPREGGASARKGMRCTGHCMPRVGKLPRGKGRCLSKRALQDKLRRSKRRCKRAGA